MTHESETNNVLYAV